MLAGLAWVPRVVGRTSHHVMGIMNYSAQLLTRFDSVPCMDQGIDQAPMIFHRLLYINYIGLPSGALKDSANVRWA